MIDATNPANVYDAIDAIVTRASERIDTNRSVAIGLIWEGLL